MLRDPERPEDFNQGVMELSFTPKGPQCPEQFHCHSYYKVNSTLCTEPLLVRYTCAL